VVGGNVGFCVEVGKLEPEEIVIVCTLLQPLEADTNPF
jgi:hypothetical protein